MSPRVALVLVGVVGCGGRVQGPGPVAPTRPAAAAVAATQTFDLEPLRIQVVRQGDGSTAVEAFDARSLFDQATHALEGEAYDEALALYDRLLADFPDSALAGPASYNAGLALEAKGDLAGAIARHQHVLDLAPKSRDAIDAALRLAADHAELGHYADARAALALLEGRADLDDRDRRELLARRGYLEVETADYDAADQTLAAATALAERSHPPRGDYFVAMARFYWAEIPHRQFLALPIRLPDEQLKADVEAKATLVLAAEKRYEEVVGLDNLQWSTAAGYQVAMMQEEMWRALVTAPVPTQLSPEAAKVYVVEVAKLARGHLEKALEVHQKNVDLADAAQGETQWSEASKARALALTEQLLAEPGSEPPPAHDEPGTSEPRDYLPARIDL